jgi:hypothetical protein
VRDKLGDHRPPITRDQHTPGVLGPAKDVGVGRGKLKIGKVADPDHIDRRRGTGIMVKDRSPEITAEMLVEKIAEGHGSQLGRGSVWSCLLSHQAADSESGRAGLGSSLLAIEIGPVLRDVGIHLGLMALIESDRASDQVRLQRWQLVADQLGGESPLVELDHRVETDPVARQDNLAFGPYCQEIGPIHGHPPASIGT